MYLLKQGSKPIQERQKRRKIDVFQLPDGSMPSQSQQQQQPSNVLMEDKEAKKGEPTSKMTSRKEYHASKQLQ